MVTNHYKIKGKQRLAVFRSMMYPGSGSFLFERAKQWAHRMTYFDLRKIMRDFEIDGLVTSLNPDEKNGRVYCLTEEGISVYKVHFPEMPTNKLIYAGSIEPLAKILRRYLVKKIMFSMTDIDELPWLSATGIKKKLRYTHSTSLSLISSTVQQLTQEGYLECNEVEIKNHLERQYRLSPLGEQIQSEIARMRRPPNFLIGSDPCEDLQA